MSSNDGYFEISPIRVSTIVEDMASTTKLLANTIRELEAIPSDPRAFGRLGMVVANMALRQVHPKMANAFSQLHVLSERTTQDIEASRRSYLEADDRHATTLNDALSPVRGLTATTTDRPVS